MVGVLVEVVVGVEAVRPHDDIGGALVLCATSRARLGELKSPTLCNIALTAPYTDDGRFGTLEEVVAG